MSKIKRTEHSLQISRPLTSMIPQGLSKKGQIFWKFINNEQKTLGNEPRELTRSRLIQLYRDDLNKSKPAHSRFMEIDHGYIQWLFPLETIGVNPEAPILNKKDFAVLSTIEDIKTKMLEHFELFTEFMGLSYDKNKGTFKKVNANQWKNWIEHPHNNLRISRILTSMKNLGLEKTALDFLKFLKIESNRKHDESTRNQVFRQFADITRKSCKDYWVKCIS